MSAIHTRQSADKMKPTPRDLAAASANQATESTSQPTHKRAPRDRRGQAAGPALSAAEPPSTQQPQATHHAAGGAAVAQPARHASTQVAPTAAPRASDMPIDNPFSRPHSQPAAEIISTVIRANGTRLSANKAGSSNASNATAVITR